RSEQARCGCEPAPGVVLRRSRSLRLRTLPASLPRLALACPRRTRAFSTGPFRGPAGRSPSTPGAAASLRLASSSVAPVAYGYERSLRPCHAWLSRAPGALGPFRLALARSGARAVDRPPPGGLAESDLRGALVC